MPTPPERVPRRRDALSRQRIVETAVALLDAEGEAGLTVRSLTSRLCTGRGALYHHIAGVADLLAAAADEVVRVATEHPCGNPTGTGPDSPSERIRALSLAIFDALDAHPWVGTQLAREPRQPAVLRIWKTIAEGLRDLGLDGAARSDAGSALASYIFGSAAQFAAGARHARDEAGRQNYLDALAAAWIEHDPDQIVHDAATHLRDHDDRAQFLAGINIFLNGIANLDT